MAEELTQNTEQNESDSEKTAKELKKTEKSLRNLRWFLLYLFVFLFVVWLLFFKIIGITHMPTGDMEPRMDAGDLLVFFRLDKKPAFREIVVFEKEPESDGKKKLLVGRVMAVPGDTVDINDSNQLIINGNIINETSGLSSVTPKRGDRVQYPLTLGEGQYFIVTDDREEGMDSRYFGPVSKKEILGTVISMFRRNKL